MGIESEAMSLGRLIPDWKSLESVRSAHNDFEGAALIFFAVLVVSEALAHLTNDEKRARMFDRIGIVFFAIAVLAEIAAFPYGQRNDTLSEQLIGSLDNKARQPSNNASKAVPDSSNALLQAEDVLKKTGAAEDAMKKAGDEAHMAQTSASRAF